MQPPFEISYAIDAPLDYADVAVVSTDNYGTPGYLSQHVADQLGYDPSFLPNGKQDFSSGYAWVHQGIEYKPLLYIVTVGGRKSSAENLKQNLTKAFRNWTDRLGDKVLWIPLMGTGQGRLSFKESFQITFQVITDISNLRGIPREFYFSLPPEVDKKTVEFIGNEIKDFYAIYESSETKNQANATQSVKDLIEEGIAKTEESFWWLQVSKWKISDLGIGDEKSYTIKSPGKPALKNFRRLKPNNLVLSNQTSEGLAGLLRVKSIDSNNVVFELIHKFESPISIDRLKSIPEFVEDAIYTYRAQSLFKVDKTLFTLIINMTELRLSENLPDKIPFHYDRVVEDDQLGREPVAIAFTDLIKKDIFTKSLDHAFMVHLQGEWGAGKSTFLNLIQRNLTSEDQKWVVVNYNAWKNQHLQPPWWTFIDQVYQQTKASMGWRERCCFAVRENLRRVIWYTGWQKILSLVLTIGFIVLIALNAQFILDFLANETLSSDSVSNSAKGLTFEVFIKILLSIGSAIGLIYSFSKFISTPLFMTNSVEAISFMKRASDPLKRIKRHFSRLVRDINKNRQLAIFIDDVDRCNRDFLIRLLEGIQTLFKEEKVLYIVAGDKQWISTSFQKQYSDFKTEHLSEGNKLGDLFLRKAFQLSIRMPQVSPDYKKYFWDHILGIKGESEPRSDAQLSEEERAALEDELAAKSDREITDPKVLSDIESKYNVTSDEISKRVIKRKNASNDELKHLLRDFHELLDTNPRSIIRLANFYTMTRSTLIAERKNYEPDMLFRWLLLKDINHDSVNIIRKASVSDDLKSLITKDDEKDDMIKTKYEKLIKGKNGQIALNVKDVKALEGM